MTLGGVHEYRGIAVLSVALRAEARPERLGLLPAAQEHILLNNASRA